jgi:hypothetical protein
MLSVQKTDRKAAVPSRAAPQGGRSMFDVRRRAHRKDCFDRHGVDHVLIRAENDEKTRLTVETDLRQTYVPPCNRQ